MKPTLLSSSSLRFAAVASLITVISAFGCSSTDTDGGVDSVNGTGGAVSGVGGTVGTGGGDGTGTGGGGTVGPTTDELETVDPKFWVSYDGDSGALTWGVQDDGTGNIVVHASATAAHPESASVSLSIPQAGLTDDMSRSKGVSFRIKGSIPILFQAQSAGVVPIASGGSCDPDAGSCWNAHEKELALTPDYVDVTILWDDLAQTWGTDTNTVVLYPSDILLLSWIIPKEVAGEFTIDAIKLIPDDGTGPQSGVASLISKAQFNAIVGASDLYTYEGFLESAGRFPAFAGDADQTWAKREIAMFLANAKWETGTFQFTEEQNPGTYCEASRPYGCPAGASAYFGRGSMQLSWNYNYNDAGQYLGIDLLGNPGQVATNPALLWETGMWFWMRPGVPGSVHTVFKQGLGATIQVINGLECNGGKPDAIAGRRLNYTNALEALGVAADGTDTGC